MIAKNYTRHPEALRFQHELFSNGYHNSPRIMRLMECIFDWTPAAPAWWTAAKAKARALAKSVKKSIGDFFKGRGVQPIATNRPAQSLAEFIAGIDGLTVNHWGWLFDAQVRTVDDLADLAPDEVSKIARLPTDQACALLQAARAHWFTSNQI